ncbi:MAG TPA: PfkB family carbohydrate kinase [Blastocatellia bacterium]|nr:PfkB family carbohydrate kinase [Blastocatellia bacterium]
MEFGITVPAGKPFDAVALGLNAVDHLIVAPRYPEFNTKIRYKSHQLAAGGQCASAMVALARLGLRTRYIGKVGDDDIGRFQINSVVSEGVTADMRVVEGAETQTAFIIIDETNGERTILWSRDSSVATLPEEVDGAAVTSGRVLHLDGHDVEAAIVAAAAARAAGVPTVLDIDNIYPGAERLLPLIDFMISSSSFPGRMTGESDLRVALRQLAESNGSLVTGATLGEDGVLVYLRGQFIHAPAFRVECRDTTGAGDAFHAGFIYGLLTGLPVEETLRFANAVAGLKCRALGARTGLPTLSETKAFLSGSL